MPATDPPRTVGVPWFRRAGVWIGIATGPGALTVGGGLAAQLPLPTLLLVIPLGALALTALAVAQGISGRRRREPLTRQAASTFGPGINAGLLNLVMALGMMGWVSFYVGIAGFSLANLLDLPGWAGALLVATALLVLSELGLDRWNQLVWITSLSALGAAIFALVVVGARPVMEPMTGVRPYDLLWGVGSVVAYGIVFAVRAGDFTWDLRADSDVYKDGIALLFPLLAFLTIGAVLYRTVGGWNLADILARIQSAALGHLFLILSIVAPALSGFHSGALAIKSIVPLSRRQSTGLIFIVGFLLGAARFDHQLLLFLDLLGAVLPPSLVVMLLVPMLEREVPRTAALTAWLLGAVTAVLFKLQGQLSYMVVGAAVSIAALKIMANRSKRTGDSRDQSTQPPWQDRQERERSCFDEQGC